MIKHELVRRIDDLLLKQYRAIMDAPDKRSAPKYIIRDDLIRLLESNQQKRDAKGRFVSR